MIAWTQSFDYWCIGGISPGIYTKIEEIKKIRR
jgi:hypothetical protein